MAQIYTRFLIRAVVVSGLAAPFGVLAQSGSFGIGTTAPNPKAALEVAASNKGLLIPRLDSVQRTGISSPPQGLLVYQTDGRAGLWYYQSGAWQFLKPGNQADNLGNHNATTNLSLADREIYLRGTSGSDTNHGLGWYGGGKLWNGVNLEGPVLYGFNGGGLGTNQSGTRATALFWNSSGNVGIGTTSPAQKLEVAGATAPTSVSVAPQLRLSRPGTSGVKWPNTFEVALGSYATGINSQSRVDFNLGNGGSNNADATVMTMQANGNVGIGTTSPAVTLHVGGVASKVRVDGLAGTGTGRLVTLAADGTLLAQNPLVGTTVGTTPQQPAAVGTTVATNSGPVSVAVNAQATRAYVVHTSSNTMLVYDISNPDATPVQLWSVATDQSPASVVLNADGSRAYVVNALSGTLQVFYTSKPSAAPVLLGSVGIGSQPGKVVLNAAGTRAYVVSSVANTLQTIDITPATPVVVGSVSTGVGASTRSVAVNPAGTRAYVINVNANTLQAYDISNPGAAPVAVGAAVSIAVPLSASQPGDIEVNAAGTRAYVTAGNGGFIAFDISNPAVAPVYVATALVSGGPRGLALNAAGTRAYALDVANNRLRTFDISNPAVAPVAAGTAVATGSFPSDVVLNPAGTRAYVVNLSSNTLQVYSIGTAPQVVLQAADGTMGAADVSSIGDNLGNHNATTNLSLGDREIYLRGTSGSDQNHGLGWYGTGKTWNGAAVDGPVLYGWGGGVLGSNQGGTRTTALTWTTGGSVGINTTNANARLTVVGAESTTNGLGAALRLQNTAATTANNWYVRAGGSGTGTPDGGLSIADDAAYRLTIANNGNTGLANTDPQTTLDVDGGLAVRANSSITVTTDNQNVTVGNRSYLRLGSDNTGAGNRTIVLSSGLQTGQMLILSNASSASFGVTNGAFEIQENAIVNTAVGNRQLSPDDTITFIWDGNKWLEVGFANN